MKTVAKAAVGHVLKQKWEDLEEGMSQITNDGQEAKNAAATVAGVATTLASHSIDATIDATVEALLKEQIEAEKNLETLKACLKELAADKPIILFIDELDRCRPDYAVDMLEVIKHVFDIENVKVVLVTNTKQLRAVINHRYGAEVDEQKYLDKFLKYSFALPDKIVDQSEEGRALVSVHYFERLIKDSGIGGDLISGYRVMECINEMIRRNNLSLRETERLVRFLEIYHSLSHGLRDRNERVLWLRVVGVFIFCFYPSLMDDINKNRTDAREFAQLFNLQSWPDMLDEPHYLKKVDVIAAMLILNSKIEDPRFTLLKEKYYWQTQIDKYFGSEAINWGLSVLKNTFQVLSFEQTPQ